MRQGQFIILDGLDNSGKSTQCRMLLERLKREKIKASKIDFPRHGEPAAWLVDNYLTGKYGSAKELGPYVPSILYACDRFDAASEIKKRLENGEMIICDRYVSSNVGHQGGKIRNGKKRMSYLMWLHKLEYEIFKIPKPDVTLILKTSPELSIKLSKRSGSEEKTKRKNAYLKDGKKDIHENDLIHLRQAMESYLWVAKKFPEQYKVIECLKDGEMLPPENVHNLIWKTIKNKL